MSLFDDNNQDNTEPSMFSPAIFQKIVKGTCLGTCAINLYFYPQGTHTTQSHNYIYIAIHRSHAGLKQYEEISVQYGK